MNATDKRLAGIKGVVEAFVSADGGTHMRYGFTVEDFVAEVDKIRSLGRTERWSKALTRWVEMVKEDPTNEQHTMWAIMQGSIYAGYAALPK
jgi:hypothetical protein